MNDHLGSSDLTAENLAKTNDAKDRLGASDCWLMFALWAAAYDHRWTSLIAFVLCAAYSYLGGIRESEGGK